MLTQLLVVFMGQDPLVVGIDQTLERVGENALKRGVFMAPATRRDTVRSSDSPFVKCIGLRWMCLMMLIKVSWANQRPWSKVAIARTTPVLMGLLSIVTLLANSLQKQGRLSCQVSRWSIKDHLTFSNAVAAVRCYLWQEINFCTSSSEKVERLKTFSEMGRKIPEFDLSYRRELIHDEYRIVYKIVNEAQIDVITSQHSSRNMTERFFDDE